MKDTYVQVWSRSTGH